MKMRSLRCNHLRLELRNLCALVSINDFIDIIIIIIVLYCYTLVFDNNYVQCFNDLRSSQLSYMLFKFQYK